MFPEHVKETGNSNYSTTTRSKFVYRLTEVSYKRLVWPNSQGLAMILHVMTGTYVQQMYFCS